MPASTTYHQLTAPTCATGRAFAVVLFFPANACIRTRPGDLCRWRQAVAEGRAAQLEAQQQAATWGKIHGWLSEVEARQRAQAKVTGRAGRRSQEVKDTCSCVWRQSSVQD